LALEKLSSSKPKIKTLKMVFYKKQTMRKEIYKYLHEKVFFSKYLVIIL